MKPRNGTSNRKLSGVETALRRAGQRARELAAKTGTPLVVYSEGKIKKLRIRRSLRRGPVS
jgi:diaminopimelate decarboxylase